MFDTTHRDTLSFADRADTLASTARMYADMLEVQAAARARYVAEIKARVQNGTYRPNLEVVAERLLVDLATPGER